MRIERGFLLFQCALNGNIVQKRRLQTSSERFWIVWACAESCPSSSFCVWVHSNPWNMMRSYGWECEVKKAWFRSERFPIDILCTSRDIFFFRRRVLIASQAFRRD
jgi:hypothetical protein